MQCGLQVEGVTSADGCQSACAVRVGCSHWTWNTDTATRFPLTCWLKSGTGEPQPATDKVCAGNSHLTLAFPTTVNHVSAAT